MICTILFTVDDQWSDLVYYKPAFNLIFCSRRSMIWSCSLQTTDDLILFTVDDQWSDLVHCRRSMIWSIDYCKQSIIKLIFYWRRWIIWSIFIIDYQWFDGTESEADLWPPRCRGEREQPETRNTTVRGHICSFKGTDLIIQS